jgi:hypothetical protein
MTTLRIVNFLLGLSIVCMAIAVYAGLAAPFLIAVMCTVLAGANRHYELDKMSKS